MDGSRAGWYFSTMRGRDGSEAQLIRRVRFLRSKYGSELLVDAGFLRKLAGFDFSSRPYALDFHDVLLVTRGRGTFALDERVYRVAPGALVFTRPGEVRRHRIAGLDGACVFFTAEFLGEFFADPSFVDRLAYFRPDRPSGVLKLTKAQRREFLSGFRRMEREIGLQRDDATHALRAQLYEMLITTNRWYVAAHGEPRSQPAEAVGRFRVLLERDFARRYRVADYARELGMTPGHLSSLCRRQLGRGASACMRERLRLEAKRLLLYTDLPASQVGYRLGFEDPAYFARFFRREVGDAPGRYRLGQRRAQARR
jgi:AraC-like DNA-binding protein